MNNETYWYDERIQDRIETNPNDLQSLSANANVVTRENVYERLFFIIVMWWM